MDYSTKVTVKSCPDQGHDSEVQADVASPPSSVDLAESSYPCPACPTILPTSRELTNHLRGHNSPRSTDCSGEEDYCCGVCNKVLSSASSLDRHVLVHSGERPFKCKYCEMAFTTNGNMNRHLRTAHRGISPHSEIGCTDSEGSSDSEKPTKRRHIDDEYNNNEIAKRNSPELTMTRVTDERGERQQEEEEEMEVEEEEEDEEGAEGEEEEQGQEQEELARAERGEGRSPPSSPPFPPPPPLMGKRKCTDQLDGSNDGNEGQKRHKILLSDSRSEMKTRPDESRNVYNCPVCGRQDFATSALLEGHLERNHPEFPAKCEACNLSFKNHRVLNLHRFMIHFAEHSIGNTARNLRNSVVGFNDLTFVDFSSDKFPAIARAVCEQSLHRPATGEVARFQCCKCLRAFPCRSALDGHEIDCGTGAAVAASPRERLLLLPDDGDSLSRRDDFFAGLDLQNKAALTEAKEGKDLADIQSIISVTSGPILQSSFPRSDASTPESNVVKFNPSIGSSGSSAGGGTFSSEYHEEEAQDAFAAEFRKMKLKGEFPCRLCSAIFPNLRALKGHNRAHMGVGPGMPYPCNMCPYTSTDKATLVRHLRSHNGDRPYECSLCNYAFTTKANCERHVRNRHGKLTREDIKSVLIYHPNEDSTNSDGNNVERISPRVTKEDVRKSLVYPTERIERIERMERIERTDNRLDRTEDYQHRARMHYSTPTMTTSVPVPMGVVDAAGDVRIIEEAKMHNDPSVGRLGRYERNESYSRSSTATAAAAAALLRPLELTQRTADDAANDDGAHRGLTAVKSDYSKLDEDLDESRSSEGSVSLVSDTKSDSHQRIQASPMNLKKSLMASSSSVENSGEDGPLDLSMDVLDLSKKSKDKDENDLMSVGAQEQYANGQKELYDAATSRLLLTEALLKAGQGSSQPNSLEALYANAHLIYRNFGTFPGVGAAGILPPYLFNPHVFGQDFSMKERLQKELVRGLQLTSGGTLVEPPLGGVGFAAFAQARDMNMNMNMNSQGANERNDYAKLINSKIITANKAGMTNREKFDNTVSQPPAPQPQAQSQPQPPSSNSVKMVIKNGVLMPKQKQRRYRTERPFTCEHCSARFTLRSNMERHIKQQHPQHWSQRPRGGHSTRGRPPSSHHPTLLQNLGQQPSSQITQSYTNILPKVEQSASLEYAKHPISDQVKYAILAQQLKANKTEENDSEEELVIDEEPKEKDAHESQEKEQRCTSLLRGQLEGIEDGKGKPVKREATHAEEPSKDISVSDSSSSSSSSNSSTSNSSNSSNSNISNTAAAATSTNATTANNNNNNNDNNNGNLDKGEETKTLASEVPMEEDKEATAEKIAKRVSNAESIDGNSEKLEDGTTDLASVSELLDNASQQYQQFQPQYLSDEEGLVASTSDCNNSGSDEKSDSVNSLNSVSTSSKKKRKKKKKKKKKSAYSMAPNRVICPYCERPFPWTSSLRRHILTHTGQKPYQCVHCSLLFTTKSNCDRHLLRKHKTNPNKIRRVRNSSSPDSQAMLSNNNSFSMRNVPERPYKCNQCPSSTFSTLGNLKKHRSTKHARKMKSKSTHGSDTPSSEARNSPRSQECGKQNEQSDYESQSSSVSESMENSSTTGLMKSITNASPSGNDTTTPRSRRPSPRSSPGPTDVPFKCHLCDCGFAERQDCLEHIKLNHKRSFEMLVAKGALDMDIEAVEDQQQPHQSHHHHHHHNPNHHQQQSDGEEKRGRFPDYSNRKVVCAFCMRRFWSAEDLRRHMRTHTGERPFSCDICCRRFTLKHSMLRHRKKHESIDSTMYVGTSGDEENPPPIQPPTITPRSHQQPPVLLTTNSGGNSRIQERISLPTVAAVATGDAAPSGLVRFNPYEKLTTLTGKLTSISHNANASANPDAGESADSDLISNLLGIRDKNFIDRVLQASADDAAKLLGVKRSVE